jgi:phenylalanine-4-hydroxylase
MINNGLRGNYENMSEDFRVAQVYANYTSDHQDVWRRLYQRQLELLPNRASSVFINSLKQLDFAKEIPRFDVVNQQLLAATGWELIGVPGLLPDEVFFTHLANRRFPVTIWIREPHEFDYIVEPDLFHDFFGHVPMLFNQHLADYVQAYGLGALKAFKLGGLTYLARLYWYTIEFGLILEPEGLRAYGAGILSSPGELAHATAPILPASNAATRQWLHFDLVRMMQTRYQIDCFQSTYFAIDSFEQLITETAPDFSLLYKALNKLPVLSPDAHETTDQRL